MLHRCAAGPLETLCACLFLSLTERRELLCGDFYKIRVCVSVLEVRRKMDFVEVSLNMREAGSSDFLP